jgi:hypothetical protein
VADKTVESTSLGSARRNHWRYLTHGCEVGDGSVFTPWRLRAVDTVTVTGTVPCCHDDGPGTHSLRAIRERDRTVTVTVTDSDRTGCDLIVALAVTDGHGDIDSCPCTWSLGSHGLERTVGRRRAALSRAARADPTRYYYVRPAPRRRGQATTAPLTRPGPRQA